MQWKFPRRVGFLRRLCFAALVALSVGCTGCPGGGAQPTRLVPPKPYPGVSVRVACGDPAATKQFAAVAAGWASRTGAAATFAVTPPDTDPAADVVLVPTSAVGAWVVKGVRPVPEAVTGEDSAAKWPRILSVYRDRLACWGSEAVAVPLAGDGTVLAYRADRFAEMKEAFRAKFGRSIAPPVTWEEVAEYAEFFAAGGKPSLPPLPADDARLLREFHLIAACYDRPALSEGMMMRRGPLVDQFSGERSAVFHYDLPAGTPRLTAPGFVAAAEWLARTNKLRMPAGADDPVAALNEGTATMAVLTLADLGRLPKADGGVDPKFGLAKLPGTRNYCDPATGAPTPPPDRATAVNYVPYFGAGGWVGMVRTTCANPDAAFDLLAELASPGRSLDRQSDPAGGCGPYRADQIEQARDDVWQRYAFDADRSKVLADAMRVAAAVSVANPVIAPRGPDQADRMKELAAGVRAAATGPSAADALKAVNDAWSAADAKNPAAREWRRKSAGLN